MILIVGIPYLFGLTAIILYYTFGHESMYIENLVDVQIIDDEGDARASDAKDIIRAPNLNEDGRNYLLYEEDRKIVRYERTTGLYKVAATRRADIPQLRYIKWICITLS